MKIYIVFFSRHGHIYRIAEAVAEGANSVEGAAVKIFRVAELFAPSIKDSEKTAAMKSLSQVPIIEVNALAEADAVIFGTPSIQGKMAGPMRKLLDQTGPLWADGAMIGKVGSVFTSTTTPDGNNESTLSCFHEILLHLGMIVVGVPFSEKRLLSNEYATGRKSYGASMPVGVDGIRLPNNTEIGIARFQGQYVAETTDFLLRGRAARNGLDKS